MTDEEILQAWDTYIADYEEKYQSVKQEADAIINDPTASNERKAQAIRDVSAQEEYLRQLKAQRDELQYDYDQEIPLPATVTFDVSGAGMICKDGNNAIHKVTLNGSSSNTILKLAVSDLFEFTLNADNSTPWSRSTSYEGFNTQHTVYGVGARTTGGQIYYQYSDSKNYFRPDSSGYWLYNNRTLYICAKIEDENSFTMNDVPTIQSGATFSPFINNVSGTPSEPVAPNNNYIALGIEYDHGSSSVDTETPWDYYNDNILPDIANDSDKVYPDGYNPPDPHDPPIEPEMNESDEGTPPETLDYDSMLTSPSLFITQYVLNGNLLNSLGRTLWSSWLTANTDVWENFLFNFASQTGTFNITAALDYIVSLRVYPFDLHAITNPTPPTGFYGSSDGVYMGTGKTNFTYDSGVTNVITINSVSGMLNLGTCEVKSDKAYNDFRDMYNCSILCYLPFCGTVELNPVDVWGRTLRCKYYIDFQSGGCTAIVECEGDEGYFPIACKSGMIGFTIPITATNAGQVAAQFASDAVRAVGTLSGMFFDVADNVGDTLKSYMAGDNPVKNTIDGMALAKTTTDGGLSLANQAIGILSRSGVNMPMLSGGTGCENLMLYNKPFIEIRRGKYAKPDNFGHSVGYANSESKRIGDYTGLNYFTGVDTTGLKCNDAERTEILSLLQSGVYL